MYFMENEKEVEEKQTEEMRLAAAALRKTIGKNISELREEVSKERIAEGEEKFTQAVLASELTERGHKITDGQIGHIESGRKFPSMLLLVALADYFETSVDHIVGRTKNRSSIEEINEDLQTGGISGRLGELYKKLPEDRQEEVYKFTQAQVLIDQNEEDKPSAETIRFVHRLIGSFSKRISIKAVEEELDILASEFPSLAPSFVDSVQSTKKKRH